MSMNRRALATLFYLSFVISSMQGIATVGDTKAFAQDPQSESAKKICLCEVHVGGTSKAGSAGGALGGIIGGAIGSASGAGPRYYREMSDEILQIFEQALLKSRAFQYVSQNSIESVKKGDELLLAETAKKNQLLWCVSAKSICAARMGWNKKIVLVTKWELVGPSGGKLKLSTEAESKETYGKFPNGADPKLKPAYLELAKANVQEFMAKISNSRYGLDQPKTGEDNTVLPSAPATSIAAPLKNGTVSNQSDQFTFSTLAISSTPSGADIIVDGKFMGNTPSKISLPVGEHEILIEKPGNKSWKRRMNVLAGSAITINAQLEPAASSVDNEKSGGVLIHSGDRLRNSRIASMLKRSVRVEFGSYVACPPNCISYYHL